MNTQDNTVTVSFVDSFQSYAADSKMMGELKTRLEDTRKILEPVIRAHKIPVTPKAENNKVWKEKRAIFFPLVQELEWPRDEVTNEKIEKDDISQTEMKRMSDRITAWLGVIRTCLEYQILPTDKNADRLRKAKVWTGLNGNGKMNPNWVDPNAPKVEATTASTPTASTPTAPATTAPATTPATQTTTPQKDTSKGEIPRANVNSSDAPIPAREHCGILLDQLFKNEAFRSEYAPIFATMLDMPLATVTRCMVQARDELNRGAK